jgi:transcription initiation factor TFIIB
MKAINLSADKKQGFIKKCPECQSINLTLDEKRGEIICKSCGLVVDENEIDISQEWREFGGEGESKRRAGSPSSFAKHDMGTGTELGDAADVYTLKGNERRKFMRLKKWHSRSSTSLERNLKYALVELRRVSSLLNVPPAIEEEAARIYRMAVTKGLVRGRSMESVVVGAIYIASRLFNLPRSLNEVCNITNTNKRDVGKTYRFIARELRIRMLPSGPIDYIPKFANKLKFTAETQTKAIEILKIAQDSELTSGRGPTGLAAAALYVASLMTGEKRTQREIADVVGVTEVTIRNRYKEMIERLELDDMLEEAKKVREAKEAAVEEGAE